jgi:hypothetical protein
MEHYLSEYVEQFNLTPKFGVIRVINDKPTMVCDPIQYDAAFFKKLVNRYGGLSDRVPIEVPAGMVDCGAVRIVPGNLIVTEKPGPDYFPEITPWVETLTDISRKLIWNLPIVDALDITRAPEVDTESAPESAE